MTNRREFLYLGLAATALPLAGTARASAPAHANPPVAPAAVPLYRVLYDNRFPVSREFGLEAARQGHATVGFSSGDITDFWFHDLDIRWKQSAVAIAGFTQHGPLFVLERMAWDRGLRVIFRAEHQVKNGGDVIEHRLCGSREAMAFASCLTTTTTDWSRQMAGTIGRCSSNSSEPLERTLFTAGGAGLHEDEPFYSWVIAPRA